MPRIDQQRTLTPVGRVRLGRRVGGKPTALAVFRFTARGRRALDKVAERYGGEVRPFEEPKSDDRWEVITEADELQIFLPPLDPVSEWWEKWAGYGCERRCDGVRTTIFDGIHQDVACVCDPDARECDPLTRVSFMLREIAARGLWRLDTKGKAAGRELPGVAEFAARATALGWSLPATLTIEQASWRGKDRDGKVVTRRFVVPRLYVDVPPEQAVEISAGKPYRPELTAAGEQVGTALPALPRPELGPAPGRRPKAAGDPMDFLPEPGELPAYDPDGEPADELPTGPPTSAPLPGEPEAPWDVLKRLHEDHRGPHAQATRHALYALASGAWQASWAEVDDGRKLNAMARYSQRLASGELTLDATPERVALIDAEGTFVAQVAP